MLLRPLDRAFLSDIAATNWMHHYVVVASLKRTGAESFGDVAAPVLNDVVDRHNQEKNLDFWERPPLTRSEMLAAQVQATVMLRIFQERIAALEDLGALLLGLAKRRTIGIAQGHYEHTTAQVDRVYGSLVGSKRAPLWRMVQWPSPTDPLLDAKSWIAGRYRRLIDWFDSRAVMAARAYLRPEGLSLGTLGHMSEGYDPRHSVFVVLGHESRWRPGRELDHRLLTKAYNMVKHGFNATADFKSYIDAARAGATAVVLEIPKSNAMAQQFGGEIDLVSVMCRELARTTLDLDDADLLPSI